MAFSWIIFLSLLVVLGRAVAPAVPYAITSYLTNHPSPASCSFYCTSLQTISSTCGESSSCLCSPSTASAVYTCASCLLVAKAAQWGDLEYALGEYATECSDAGTPISYLTLIPPC